MNNDIKFYINVLSDFINERKTKPTENIDWEKIKEYAYNHNTNGIVFYQCRDFMPKEIYVHFNSLYMAEIYSYGKRINLTRSISDSFIKNNITYCLLKGTIVSSNYPIPALRTMGDSDFLVKQENIEKAYKLMDELGFTLEASLNERAYYKNNLEFEIHYSLNYEKDISDSEIDFYNSAFNYINNNVLDKSYHFIFLLLHLKKHLLNAGIGFRQFMDLAVEIKKSDLDWNFIYKEIDKMNLTKFMNTCLFLTYEWFGIKNDREIVSLDKSFIEEATLKILKNGVQGFSDKENNENTAFNKISDGKKVNFFSKTKYIMELYFPSYDYFKNDVNYRFLQNKKYLLPIAWIYRFYLSIKNNNALFEIKRSIKGIFMSKKEIEKRKSNKDNWGL